MIKKIKVLLIVGLVALSSVACMSSGKNLKQVKKEVSKNILPKIDYVASQLFEECYMHVPNSLDNNRLIGYSNTLAEIEQMTNNLYEERDKDDAEIERIFKGVEGLRIALTDLNNILLNMSPLFSSIDLSSDIYNKFINEVQKAESVYNEGRETVKEAVNFK